jgi:hypothetical protein
LPRVIFVKLKISLNKENPIKGHWQIIEPTGNVRYADYIEINTPTYTILESGKGFIETHGTLTINGKEAIIDRD